MRNLFFLSTVAVAAVALQPAHAAGAVQVTYVEPENFADAGRSVLERERTLNTLTVYFQQLGEGLPPGQTLKLDVSQVDLAGQLKPTRYGEEVRVLNGRVDWPRITLHYTLNDGTSTPKTGDAHLRDIDYQFGLRGAGFQRDELAYEKRMIATWFKKTFLSRTTAATGTETPP